VASSVEDSALFDVSKASGAVNPEIHLPFDVSSVIENLRRERYVRQLGPGRKRAVQRAFVRKAYYIVREHLPVWVRHYFQKAYLGIGKICHFHIAGRFHGRFSTRGFSPSCDESPGL